MNKTDLVNAIADKAGISKTDAKKALEGLLLAATDALASGDRISIAGFGTFSVSEKASRLGFNPRTKQSIEIPARRTVKFKPSNELAEKVK